MDQRYKRFEDASRDVGIILENLETGMGEHGVSVLVQDASKPVRIHLPTDVLLPTEIVDYDANKVKDDAQVSATMREYWNSYLELALNDSAVEERKKLEEVFKKESLVEWADSNGIVLLNNFLRISATDGAVRELLSAARTFGHKTLGQVHIPYLDFVNYGNPALRYRPSDEGISLEGDSPGPEVLVTYNLGDSLSLLNAYGFFTPTNFAYAVQSGFKPGDGNIYDISKTFGKRLVVNGKGMVPVVSKHGNRIEMSFCLLGNKMAPGMALQSFYAGIEQAQGLTREERQTLASLRHPLMRLSLDTFWRIYQRAENIKDENLRLLLLNASSDVIRAATAR